MVTICIHIYISCMCGAIRRQTYLTKAAIAVIQSSKNSKILYRSNVARWDTLLIFKWINHVIIYDGVNTLDLKPINTETTCPSRVLLKLCRTSPETTDIMIRHILRTTLSQIFGWGRQKVHVAMVQVIGLWKNASLPMLHMKLGILWCWETISYTHHNDNDDTYTSYWILLWRWLWWSSWWRWRWLSWLPSGNLT